MSNGPAPTRRTLLRGAGVAACSVTLGGVAHAKTRTNSSGAGVDWFQTYPSEDGFQLVSLFDDPDGYVSTRENSLHYYADDGSLRHSYGLPDETVTDTVRTTDSNFLHSAKEQPDRGYAQGKVVKTDAEGNRLWKWVYEPPEGGSSRMYHAVAGPNGGGYAFGQVGVNALLGVRLDATGDVIWSETWGDYRLSPIPAYSGGVVGHTVGSSIARVTAEGTVAWKRTYDEWWFEDLVRGKDGGYVALVWGRNSEEAALMFVDTEGRQTDLRQFTVPSGSSYNAVRKLAKTDAGCVVVGHRDENRDGSTYQRIWALGLTPSGDRRWYVEPGSDDVESSERAITSGPQSVVIGGRWGSAERSETYLTRLSEGSDEDHSPTPTETPTESPTDSEPDSTTDTEAESPTDTEAESPTDGEAEPPTDTDADPRPDGRTTTEPETGSPTPENSESEGGEGETTTRRATESGSARTTGTDRTGTSPGGPGFGPLATLGGLGLGAWRLLRRSDEQ